MSVKLQKGQKVSLSKEHAGLSKVIVGLGWDEVQQQRRGLFAPKPQDIDMAVFSFHKNDYYRMAKFRTKNDIAIIRTEDFLKGVALFDGK